jgi:hypothetical protein
MKIPAKAAAVASAVCLLALCPARAQPLWPASPAAHAAYFCGADNGEFTDDTAPRGYSLALADRLRELGRQGMTAPQAMAELRRRVDCTRFVRQSTWSRVDGPLLHLLNWTHE